MLEGTLSTYIEVLRKVEGEFLSAKEIGARAGGSGRQMSGMISGALRNYITRGGTSIKAEMRRCPDTGKDVNFYCYVPPSHDYFEGWRNPVTGIKAPRLGL